MNKVLIIYFQVAWMIEWFSLDINNNNIFNTKITPIVLLGNDLGKLWNNWLILDENYVVMR